MCVCVLGDLNARVGDVKVQGVIGDYGVPGMNESGEWMLDWCMQYEMTMFTFSLKRGTCTSILGSERSEV